ncbi:hypothetical protein AV530_008677 [Patagioenas fasciata monilis]|uniref:Uncharacterized protein n=1 Tax=Patagioenas fasciata monilis TaxID=372326 RepID=A0A1V4L1I8_PATFA|nr:hypothetical protein AV530_008677 [Patagioenas fasciata monilis]
MDSYAFCSKKLEEQQERRRVSAALKSHRYTWAETDERLCQDQHWLGHQNCCTGTLHTTSCSSKGPALPRSETPFSSMAASRENGICHINTELQLSFSTLYGTVRWKRKLQY